MSPEKTPEAQMREFFRLLQQGNEQAVIEPEIKSVRTCTRSRLSCPERSIDA